MILDRVRGWSAENRKRILIDSMIVDCILKMPGLIERIQRANDQGALVIVETHILKDQLSAAPDDRRTQLLEVYEALPKQPVTTGGFVLDVSKLDGGDLTDDATAASINRLRTTGGLGGMADALLAITASGKADAIVTEDKELLKKLTALGVPCDVWQFDRFRQFVENLTK